MTDPWEHLRPHTPARIALGRAGPSLPTRALLAFASDHAAARDAVHEELDVEQVQRELSPLGVPILTVRSAAADRAQYLRRPDLGRQLSDDSRELLARQPRSGFDLAITLADGLSATAAARHGAGLLRELLPHLSGLKLAPLTLATQARVALQDEIGSLLGARLALILLGERPGLSAPDSLGAYFVFGPKAGNTDADRNCISNIRPAGFPLKPAAETIAYLLHHSLTKQLSGVHLKDDRPRQLPQPIRRTPSP
jgi:ethanolamine ammonia-lyase small subunit